MAIGLLGGVCRLRCDHNRLLAVGLGRGAAVERAALDVQRERRSGEWRVRGRGAAEEETTGSGRAEETLKQLTLPYEFITWSRAIHGSGTDSIDSLYL